MKVIITKNAKLDLIDIIDYIAHKTSKSIAGKNYKKIKDKINYLKDHPCSRRCIPELEKFSILKYREIIESPWRIFYEIKDGKVYVINIIDGRRNIEDILFKKLFS